MKHYTTIEESKKLLELGLSPDSADMYYFLDPTPVGNIYHLVVKRIDIGVKNLPEYNEGDIPCWSLVALLAVIDNTKDEVFFYTLQHDMILGWMIDVEGGGWYEETDFFDNPVDACYKMVVWLLENGYIKKGE